MSLRSLYSTFAIFLLIGFSNSCFHLSKRILNFQPKRSILRNHVIRLGKSSRDVLQILFFPKFWNMVLESVIRRTLYLPTREVWKRIWRNEIIIIIIFNQLVFLLWRQMVGGEKSSIGLFEPVATLLIMSSWMMRLWRLHKLARSNVLWNLRLSRYLNCLFNTL